MARERKEPVEPTEQEPLWGKLTVSALYLYWTLSVTFRVNLRNFDKAQDYQDKMGEITKGIKVLDWTHDPVKVLEYFKGLPEVNKVELKGTHGTLTL